MIWISVLPDKKYIAKLKNAIRATLGCGAHHFTTVPVMELFRGEIAWQGDVEIFDLIKHPKAQHCYAWGYYEGETMHMSAVLGLPPVNSAETAVRVVLAAKAKENDDPIAQRQLKIPACL